MNILETTSNQKYKGFTHIILRIILSIILLNLSKASFSQWESQAVTRANWNIKFAYSVKDKIFIATNNGELYSTNKSGKNLQKVNTGLISNNNDLINSFEFRDEMLFVSTQNDGLLVSDNFGSTWRKLLAGKQVYYATIYNKMLFVCYKEGTKILFSKSTDNGVTWQVINLPLTTPIFKMGFTKEKLYLASNKFFGSIDNGTNWLEINTLSTLLVNDFIVEEDFLLLSQGVKIFKSTDKGALWKETRSDFSSRNFFKHKEIIIMNNGINSVNASYDKGNTWFNVNDGIFSVSTAGIIGDFLVQNDTLILAANLSLNNQIPIDSVGFWRRSINEFSPSFLQAPNRLRTSSNKISFEPFEYIKFEWSDNSHNEQGFIIERNNGPGTSMKEIDRVEKEVNYYTDISAERNVLYTYRVKAFNETQISKSTNGLRLGRSNQCDLFEMKGVFDIKLTEIFDNNLITFTGTKGNLLKYKISENSWEQLTTPAPFVSISNVNKDTYFGVAKSNRLYFTDDAGKKWNYYVTDLNFNDSFNRSFIDFTSRNVGFALADPVIYGAKALYKTINGGKNWNKVNLKVDARDIYFMDFVSENVGFIRTDKFSVTSNGGLVWNDLTLPNDSDGKANPIKNIQLFDGSTIFSVSKNNLWVSNDFGFSWKKFVVDPAISKFLEFTEVQFDSKQTGMVYFKDDSYSPNNTVIGYRTLDGGQTWSKVFVPPLSKEFKYNYKFGVLVRNNDVGIEKTQLYDFKKEVWQDINFMFFRVKNIEWIAENNAFLLDTYGIGMIFEKFTQAHETNLFTTNNGGISWQKTWQNNFEKEVELKFFDKNNGILITNFNNYVTKDGGRNWEKVNPSVFRKVFELGRNYSGIGFSFQILDRNTWIFELVNYSSDYYKVLITNDGGMNWQEIYNKKYNQIFFKNKNEGFLITGESYENELEIFRTINGGKNWTFFRKTAKGSQYVKFLDDLNGYFFDGKLGLLKSKDGGKTWESTNVNTVPADIVMLDNSNGYFTSGYLGSMSQTKDGGYTWFPCYFVNGSNYQELLGSNRFSLDSKGNILGYKSTGGVFLIKKSSVEKLVSKTTIKAEARVCENEPAFFKAEVNGLPELNATNWFCTNNRIKFQQTTEQNKVSTIFNSLGETNQTVHYIVTNGCEEEKVSHQLYIKPAPKDYKIIQDIPGQLVIKNTKDSLKWFYFNNLQRTPQKLDQTYNVLIAPKSGFYFAELTTSEGCKIISPSIEVKSILTSLENESIDEVSLFPNPTNLNRISIKYSKLEQIIRVDIYNLAGLKVMSDLEITNQSEIYFDSLKSGRYILKLTDKSGNAISESFIVY